MARTGLRALPDPDITDTPSTVQLYERLLAGFRSYAAARLLTQVVSWAGTVYIVRKLDSHAFGLFGISLVAFNYVSMVYDGTLTETIVQRYPATAAARRSVFTLLLGIGVLTTGVMAALAEPVAFLMNEPRVGPLIGTLSCALLLTSLTVLPHATLIRQMAFPRLAIISGLQAIITTVTSVALAYSGAGPWSMVLAMVAGMAVRAVALNIVAPCILAPTRHLREAFSYLRFGGVLLVDNILWRWYVSLDTFLLGRWSGATSLGYYSVAQQLADMPLEKISTIANDVALPAYAELSADKRGAAQLMLETIRTHATVGFPIFWGLAAVANTAVPVLFGAKWELSILPLMALCAVAPLRLIGSVETPAMTGLGRPGVLLQTKLIIAPVMTIALIVGARFGGINGAALAWLVAFPMCYALAFRLVLRAAELPYRVVVGVIRGPATAAALMFAVVRAWEIALAATGLASIVILASAIVIGAVIYAGALRLVDGDAFRLAHSRFGHFLGLRQPQ